MKWILLLIVVNVNVASDIPGKVTLEFNDKVACEDAAASMKYWLKFNGFKVVASCQEKS